MLPLLALDKNTLEYQLGSRPFSNPLSLGAVFLGDMAEACNAMHQTPSIAPEKEALEFYVANHIMAQVRMSYCDAEPLGDVLELATLYNEVGMRASARMMLYLFIITIREARHIHNFEDFNDGSYAAKYLKGNLGKSYTVVVKRILSGTSKCSALRVIKLVHKMFTEGSWGSSYGGKSWAAVSKCLLDLLSGETSPEIMLDTAYTLCHNTGAIFNKGVIYRHHTGVLNLILDVQRSGQTPTLAKVWGESSPYVTGALLEYITKAEQVLPSKVTSEHIDWYAVEALGGLGSYKKEQKQMDGKGISSPYNKKDKPEPIVQQCDKQPTLVVDYNTTVEIVERS